MVLPSVAFVAGAGLLQIQPQLPSPMLAGWLVVPLLGLALWHRQKTPPRILKEVLLCLVTGAIGFAWAAICAQQRLADELPFAWEGRDVRLIGAVARLPQPFERGTRFELDVERVVTPGAVVPKRILLVWYGASRRGEPEVAPPGVRVGERWQMSVRLRRPHGAANPHGFDYEAWLLERGIRATGYVRSHDPPQRLDSFVPSAGHAVERLRERIRDRVQRTLAGGVCAGVIAALVMGDQGAIPAEQWRVFTRTGVNHLMSISGLHVTMIATLVYAAVHALWRRSVRLVLRLPARRAAVLAGFLAAVLYAAVAGFAVPAQRTVYMLGVMALALWLGQSSSAATVLAAALVVVTLLDPWAVMAPGFWLSFGAVALILYVSVGPLRSAHWALVWARTQWAVTLGLGPLLLAMFQQVSLVSPFANAFAIPAIGLLVVPTALAGSVLPVDAILHLAHAAMALTMAALERLAALPQGVWQQHAPAPWALVLALCAIAWMLLPRGFPARWVGAACLLPLFLVLPPAPQPGSMRMAVLDVGQGLAIVIRTHAHALLYDTGPFYSPDADGGSRIVVPYLRAIGVRRLDGMIVSHEDADHAGGAASVLAAIPVGWLASSLSAAHGLHELVRDSRPCVAGQGWEWDGVRFEFLHPPSVQEAQRRRANDRSCVLRLTVGRTRVLIAGDIEARSEREMLGRGEPLLAEVLVAPHHGSVTSSTSEFVAAVAPRVVVFSAGYRNRFGHPRAEVLERYVGIGSRIVRSDRHGAAEFEIGPEAFGVVLERERRRRYWQDPLLRD